MPKRQLQGKIISDKMKNTVVVEVERIKEHPKYKRRYKQHKRYKADAKDGECQLGDRVVIEECRPISKDKKWKVVRRITSHIGDSAVKEAKASFPPSSAKGGLGL
ncbi:MAG: 30S ribosomal protein S17 [bacterium]